MEAQMYAPIGPRYHPHHGEGIGLGRQGSMGLGVGMMSAGGAARAEYKRPWRKGKWLAEEEEFTKKLIECFNKGYLGIMQGTTLRSCLSERLNWYVMRPHGAGWIYHM
jgi:hypothetical protein